MEYANLPFMGMKFAAHYHCYCQRPLFLVVFSTTQGHNSSNQVLHLKWFDSSTSRRGMKYILVAVATVRNPIFVIVLPFLFKILTSK